MPFNNLPKKYQIRIAWFGCPHLRPLSVGEYFDCISFLRPLFKRTDFQNSTPGFYINYANENSGKKRTSVRLTYFTNSPLRTRKVIKNFGKKHSDKIKIYSLKLSLRTEIYKSFIFYLNPKNVDDSLFRFNKFLNAYTQIGLDLLENFRRDCSRKLVADYRFNYNPHHPNLWRIYPKEFFEPIFSKHSQFFKNLNDDYSNEQFWEDLKRADSRGVWLHFLVNMLLPADCCSNREGKIEYGKDIPEITKRNFLNMINLDLPDNWRDSCNF